MKDFRALQEQCLCVEQERHRLRVPELVPELGLVPGLVRLLVPGLGQVRVLVLKRAPEPAPALVHYPVLAQEQVLIPVRVRVRQHLYHHRLRAQVPVLVLAHCYWQTVDSIPQVEAVADSMMMAGAGAVVADSLLRQVALRQNLPLPHSPSMCHRHK